MNHRFQPWLGLAVSALAAAAANAQTVMTFDPLTPDFSSFTTYTEAGLTLAATTPGNHFYAVSTPDLSSTAAQIFTLDGAPQRLTAGGSSFGLVSVDLPQVDSGVTVRFTSSAGVSVTSSAAGTVTFGAGFGNVQWVDIGFGGTPDGVVDSSFVIDNLTAVPEPAEWTAMAGILCLAGGIAVRVARGQRA